MRYLILTTYIIRLHVAPFLLSFVVIILIFVLDHLRSIVDAVVGKGLSVWTVLAYFGYSFSWMVAMAVPMAVLISALMVFARLSEMGEIVAMRSAGMSPARMMIGPLMIGAMLALVMAWFNNAVMPDANQRARILLTAMQRSRPAISLMDREGMFIDDFPGYRLRVDKVRMDSPSPLAPYEGSRVEGVILYELDPTGRRTPAIITAEWGVVEIWGDGTQMRLTLHDGEMHRTDPEQPSRYLRTTFEKQIVNIAGKRRNPGGGSSNARNEWRNDREMSAGAMLKRIEKNREHIRHARLRLAQMMADSSIAPRHRKQEIRMQEQVIARKERLIRTYQVEVHKKYAIASACLMFILVGAPLGMQVKKGSAAAGVTLSVLIFLLYWMALTGGEELADRGWLPPWFSMWIANFALGALGVLLVAKGSSEWSVFRTLKRVTASLKGGSASRVAVETLSEQEGVSPKGPVP